MAAQHDRSLCWDADLTKPCTCPCDVCVLTVRAVIPASTILGEPEHDGVYREGDLTYRGR